MYHDYKSGSLVKLEYDEAWAAAVAKASGGRIRAKKEDMGEEGMKEEGVKEEDVKEEGVKEEGGAHRERR